MQKSKKMIRLITNMAMMIALSVVIGIFCKTVLNFGNGLFRITFENLPIILTGIALGPVAGGVVGLSSDIISYLLSPQTYPLNIVVTIGAAVIGILSGLISKYIIKRKCKMQIIVSSSVSHLVGSMIIKSIGLYSYYGVLVLWRIPLYIAISTVEIILLCLLLQSKAFSKTVGYIEELK